MKRKIIFLWLSVSIIIYAILFMTGLHKPSINSLYARNVKGENNEISLLVNGTVGYPLESNQTLTTAENKGVKNATKAGVTTRPKGEMYNGEETNNPPPLDPGYIINNPLICKNRNVTYIAYLHSSPRNRYRRNMIRNTWANKSLFSDGVFERVFLMGLSQDTNVAKSIQEESAMFGDIVQGDFMDSYRNLTLKGVLGLKWISEYCRQAKFAIKTDDDTFVDIISLVTFLESKTWNNKSVLCNHYKGNMPILRNPKTCMKWCVSHLEFPGKRMYPSYCSGLGFVLSRDMIPLMYNASKATHFFWVDDVYITGLLTRKIPNVTYIQLGKKYSLLADDALHSIEKTGKSNYLFLHQGDMKKFNETWQALLALRSPTVLSDKLAK